MTINKESISKYWKHIVEFSSHPNAKVRLACMITDKDHNYIMGTLSAANDDSDKVFVHIGENEKTIWGGNVTIEELFEMLETITSE